MIKILLIEDNEALGLAIQDSLVQEGYIIEWVKDLREAFAIDSITYDLILLDWMLPDGQGIDFLKTLRKSNATKPVIFLTARTELVDKILGLELGASDYITKPFESRELIARIRARMRENKLVSSSEPKPEALIVGLLSIDKEKHKVIFDGQSVSLVKKEFDLLYLLAESPEKVFSREELLNKVWGFENYPTTRTVDTHVMLLRQKLNNELIETVRAVGYRLKVL